MNRYGVLTWAAIATDLAGQPSCPKLQSYWHFHDCGYRKISRTCNEPEHFSACPLPLRPLRNGRLNQTAYALFFFIRDLADGDLVACEPTRLPARGITRALRPREDAGLRPALGRAFSGGSPPCSPTPARLYQER